MRFCIGHQGERIAGLNLLAAMRLGKAVRSNVFAVMTGFLSAENTREQGPARRSACARSAATVSEQLSAHEAPADEGGRDLRLAGVILDGLGARRTD